MILIGEILVSDTIVKKNFHCNLSACKGACCYEGDYGAPLEKEEQEFLEQPPAEVLKLLREEAKAKINAEGGIRPYKENKTIGTNLMEDGSCVFLYKDEIGISFCAIEKAYKEGSINMNKPISCHLYPVRVSKNEHTQFEALNYDEWDICAAACTLGDEKKIPIYKFVKDALIRKYGADFYEALDGAAQISNKK